MHDNVRICCALGIYYYAYDLEVTLMKCKCYCNWVKKYSKLIIIW